MDLSQRESPQHLQAIGPTIAQAHQLDKAGNPDQALQLLQPHLQAGEMPTYYAQPAAWVIYHYLKAHAAQLPPQQASQLLQWYLGFCDHKPSLHHSFIMVAATAYARAHQQNFALIPFALGWGLEQGWRDDDFVGSQGATPDGKPVTYPSLAVKTATLIYKELKRSHDPQQAAQLLPFFELVARRCPAYAFTPLYIANLHAWMGHKQQAIDRFRQMLITGQQWYLWQQLAALVDDPALATSCLCQALATGPDENYLGEAHLQLAAHLQHSDPPQAARELQTYVDTCTRNRWRLRDQARTLQQALTGIAPAPASKAYYRKHAAAAIEFAFACEPQALCLFTGQVTNKAGKARARLTCRNPRLTLIVPLTPALRKAQPGDQFLCRYQQQAQRATLLTATPTGKHIELTPRNASDSRTVEALVQQPPGKPFAFVDGCFVTPRLVQQHALTAGQRVKAQAVKLPDGRWRVTKILQKL